MRLSEVDALCFSRFQRLESALSPQLSQEASDPSIESRLLEKERNSLFTAQTDIIGLVAVFPEGDYSRT